MKFYGWYNPEIYCRGRIEHTLRLVKTAKSGTEKNTGKLLSKHLIHKT